MSHKETAGTAWTWFKGEWHEGNPQVMGTMSHAPWLGSCVFDGARAFAGVAPDLDLHCQRVVRSAQSFGLKIVKSAGELEELIRDFCPAPVTVAQQSGQAWANLRTT